MKRCVVALLLLLAGLVHGQTEAFDRQAGVEVYFARHNAALTETPHTENTPRKFSWVQKVTAFDRDGWKCVVCSSEERLEMDHAVALMNGGENEIHNLYALCHDCHVVKTRMDRALKKRRVQLAKELDVQRAKAM